MANMSMAEFADRVMEDMSVIWRELLKQQIYEFYKVKLTLPQLTVLELVYKTGELNMSDMARSLNVTTAAMTGIVDRLVREGYVARMEVPDDRRVIKIKLTPKGEKTVKEVIMHKRHMIIKMFSAISDLERDNYLKILTRIRKGFKE